MLEENIHFDFCKANMLNVSQIIQKFQIDSGSQPLTANFAWIKWC